MINLEFSVAIALYILLALAVIFSVWIMAEIKKKMHPPSGTKVLWNCPICANIYWTEAEAEISRCPHCQSFNKKVLPNV